MAVLHEPFKSGPGPSVPGECESYFPDRQREPRTLHAHPEQRGVLIEATRDGDDFIRVCGLHQFASVPTPGYAPACPFCVCESEEWRGRKRYAALHRDGVRIVGDWC